MATKIPIPDVQLINLAVILAVQADMRRNPAEACFKYNLCAADVPFFESLGADQLWALVGNLNQCIFQLRPELLRLAIVPPGMAGIMALASRPATKDSIGLSRFPHK